MGVMSCNRRGCESIMCSRISSAHGYICNECYEELCTTHPLDIEAFMDSSKTKKINYGPVLEEIFRLIRH